MSEVTDVGQIVFPVLALSSDGSIICLYEPCELQSCSHSALRRGYFTGLVVLDSAGRRYTIRSATAGNQPILAALLNRQVRVAVDIASSATIELGEAKAMVRRQIELDPDFWSSGGDVEELLERVNDAGDWAGFLRIFPE